MNELIYAGEEVEGILKKKYPNCKITDASDFIHTERFEFEAEGITEEDFYPFAIRKGFARNCFGFEVRLQSLKFPEPKDHPRKHQETKILIDRWIEKAKEKGND